MIFFVTLIFSVILHEVMHGWVAEKLGDPTARSLGRITLKPGPHIDPLGTILLPALFIVPALLTGSSPGAFIAWAKPVPVNPMYFKEPKKDMALVALSGPATNIGIAIIFALLYNTFLPFPVITEIIFINLFLALLNLIPLPPLDGSKVISIVLSDEAAFRFQSIGQMGIFFLFFLLMVTPLGNILRSFSVYLMRMLGVF